MLKVMEREKNQKEVAMEKMITFGIDIGSGKHHFVIFIPEEQLFEEEFVVPHNQSGFEESLSRIRAAEKKYHAVAIGGMEGSGGYANPFDQYLIDHGVSLKQVNSFKLSRYRELFGQPFKNDEYDAKLIASFVANHKLLELDERKCLHDLVRKDPQIQRLKILTRYQSDLVKEQTRYKNRLQKDIKGYFPEYLEIVDNDKLNNYNSLSLLIECFDIESLNSMYSKQIAELRAPESKAKVGEKLAGKVKAKVKSLTYQPEYSPATCEVIKREAMKLLELKKEIKELDKEISELDIEEVKIVSSFNGAGIRSAGRLVGELVTIERFHSPDAVALYCGVAGLDDKSGKREWVRAARKINHRAKNALMNIAFASIQFNPKSGVYYAKKRAEGKNHWAAVKCLARQIIKVLYAMLMNRTMYDPNYKSLKERPVIIDKRLPRERVHKMKQARWQKELINKFKSHTLPASG